MIIGHNINLQWAAGLHLGEGELAVFEPDASAEFGFRLVERIPPDRWPEAERDARP